jgi:protein associated with RNAse G/E
MITVNKLNPLGEKTIQYQGEVLERIANGVIIQAYWKHAPKDLGYVSFEPGDQFIEYYYADRWFNIFEISDAGHKLKGWYCNIAEPADIHKDTILQKDLLLDVWVDPWGKPLILDEDEFEADTMLDDRQRTGAKLGLSDLLQMITSEIAPFSYKQLTKWLSV